MKDKYIAVAGHQIRFVEKGTGPPLVLLHGMGGSLEWWEYNLDSFSRKFQTIAFDFPGFGFSSKSGMDFREDAASNFMVSFLDAFQLPKASLIGNSMGGFFALLTAANQPERIEKLVLVDNVGFGPKLSIPLRLGTVFPLGELALSVRNHLTAKIFLNRLFYDSQKIPSHLIPTVLKIFNMPQIRKVCLQILRSGVNLKGLKEKIWLKVLDRASSLPHKTLIVWGKNDKVAPLDQAYIGKKLIKNSQLHVFERCGHLPQVEWAEEFNRIVLDFLES
ncbi:MAG: alpha/beta fold hydrolase [Candidatus Aminicenantes bacterium]|nr:MAG: alpha/beta fold hydrolase [Candidatus Aminicenantes bacterium]